LLSLGYAATDGIVLESKVIETRGDESVSYRPGIKYAYEVNGRQYACDRYRYGDFSTHDGSAQRIVAASPVERRIRVYYSPSDPADAVLLTGMQGADLFAGMFLTPFNAVMFGMWWGCATVLRKRRGPPIAGGVKFWDDGYQTHVRLPRIAPAAVFLLCLFGLTFVGVFALAFSVGVNPSLAAAASVWGIVLGTALVAYLVARAKQAGGAVDLVIDDLEKSVTLPRTFGRKEPQVVAAKHLKSVVVEDIARTDSEGATSHTYAPTLVWVDQGGVKHCEKLAEWGDSDSAENFAAWLRERLDLTA
jgi:hypothetical protein